MHNTFMCHTSNADAVVYGCVAVCNAKKECGENSGVEERRSLLDAAVDGIPAAAIAVPFPQKHMSTKFVF